MPETSGNLLLAALPPAVRRPCVDAGERVSVRAGEEIVTQGDRSRHAFFPTSAVCSLTMGLKSGDKAECASVGAEGMVGLALLTGAPRSPFSAIVQIAAAGYRVPLATLAELLQDHAPLREAMLTYTGFALSVVGRAMACDSYHSIAERLARWLLMTRDRAGADRFKLTQDFIAQMLAIRRQSVTVAARALQKAGLIRYAHGDIAILDGEALEESSCTCYQAVRREFERLLQP